MSVTLIDSFFYYYAGLRINIFTWTRHLRVVQVESFRISLTLSGNYDLKRYTSCVCSGRAEQMAAIYCYRNELRGRERSGMGIEG
jgi:hypothetical protein